MPLTKTNGIFTNEMCGQWDEWAINHPRQQVD